MNDLTRASGSAVRQACRASTLTGPTPGLALGSVQANLVILPREFAFDFLLSIAPFQHGFGVEL